MNYIYLLTDEKMQEITDALCCLNKLNESQLPSHYRNKISVVINILANIPYVSNKTTAGEALQRITDLLIREEHG